jgi:hypothetical protein
MRTYSKIHSTDERIVYNRTRQKFWESIMKIYGITDIDFNNPSKIDGVIRDIRIEMIIKEEENKYSNTTFSRISQRETTYPEK